MVDTTMDLQPQTEYVHSVSYHTLHTAVHTNVAYEVYFHLINMICGVTECAALYIIGRQLASRLPSRIQYSPPCHNAHCSQQHKVTLPIKAIVTHLLNSVV